MTDPAVLPDWLDISPEVREALTYGGPVVALETTILSFGLPQPMNREVGAACEAAVREAGAIPATLAIMDGAVRVGLPDEAVEFFCSRDQSIRKVNPQNFAAVMASGAPGALTVAACLTVCAAAGIKMFATGGIGGVHRGYAAHPDISADLTALSRFQVACVSSGAKSILDVGATVEALETLGVPVVGVGTDSFPRFHCRSSAWPVSVRCDAVANAARLVQTHFEVVGTGVLVAVPIPEKDEMPATEIDAWVAQAQAMADREGVSGRDVTPFLLSALERLSGGRTVLANRGLVVNNAATAGRLAVAFAALT